MRARARLICSRLTSDHYAAHMGRSCLHTLEIAILFCVFGMPDPQLDAILLHLSLLHASPPRWPLVLAFHTETDTGRAGWLTLIALFPSKTTCITTYDYVSFDYPRTPSFPEVQLLASFSSH